MYPKTLGGGGGLLKGNGGGMSLHMNQLLCFLFLISCFVVVVVFCFLFIFDFCLLQQPVKRNGQVLGHRVINCTHQHQPRTGPKRK